MKSKLGVSDKKTPRTDALRKRVSMGEAAFDEMLAAHADIERELAEAQGWLKRADHFAREPKSWTCPTCSATCVPAEAHVAEEKTPELYDAHGTDAAHEPQEKK